MTNTMRFKGNYGDAMADTCAPPTDNNVHRPEQWKARIRERLKAKAVRIGSYQGNDFYVISLSDVLAAVDEPE